MKPDYSLCFVKGHKFRSLEFRKLKFQEKHLLKAMKVNLLPCNISKQTDLPCFGTDEVTSSADNISAKLNTESQ